MLYFEISLPQASKLKEIGFTARKIISKFEGHGHFHCKHNSVGCGSVKVGKVATPVKYCYLTLALFKYK